MPEQMMRRYRLGIGRLLSLLEEHAKCQICQSQFAEWGPPCRKRQSWPCNFVSSWFPRNKNGRSMERDKTPIWWTRFPGFHRHDLDGVMSLHAEDAVLRRVQRTFNRGTSAIRAHS